MTAGDIVMVVCRRPVAMAAADSCRLFFYLAIVLRCHASH